VTDRHFIETQDFTKRELLDLIELIRIMKEADKQGVTPRLLKGTGIIFIPTAIGYAPPEQKGVEDADCHDAWQVVQRGHAVANACYVAAVNRVGFETGPEGRGGIDFWGQSFVANPLGRVLKQASEDSEEVLVCPVDLSFVEGVRRSESFPFRDRRIDSYGGLTKLYLDANS